jgi:hypothetical protein
MGSMHFVVAYFTYNETSEHIRAHDKYFYIHGAIVVFSISVEICLSTLVKIRRRERPSEQNGAIEVRDSTVSVNSPRFSVPKDGLHENLLSEDF